MKFEHFALNVPDSRAMAKWYVDHCAMRIVYASETLPYGRFLADSTGRTVLEIYSNPTVPIPDYYSRSALMFHFAFQVDDVDAMREALIGAGAVAVEELRLEDGSRIHMLRDPWGVPLQLCQRTEPLP